VFVALPRAAERTLPRTNLARVEPNRGGSLSRGKGISVCSALSVETVFWRSGVSFAAKWSVDQLPRAVIRSTVGHAIAQAVSRRLPTAAAPVRAQVRSCGICGGQNGTGVGFLRVLLFPRRSQWRRGLRHEPSSPARTLDRGFESQSRHGRLCVRLFFVCVVLCVGSGLATGLSPVQGVLPTVYGLRN
jgi:hypothetical protein